MADYQWVAASGGSWSTTANWNPVGGPQVGRSVFGRNSAETAEFATGSPTVYTVSGNGDAAAVTVTKDIVTFESFSFSNVSGAALTITGGARLTIAAGSTISLLHYNGAPGGPVVVSGGSDLVVYGSLSASSVQVTGGSHVTLSGAGAALKGAVQLDAGSTLSVVEGASFTTAAAGLLGGAPGSGLPGGVVVGGGSTVALTGDVTAGTGFPGTAEVLAGGTLSLVRCDGVINLLGGTAKGEGPPSAPPSEVGGLFGTIAGYGNALNWEAMLVAGKFASASFIARGGLLYVDVGSPGNFSIESGASLKLHQQNVCDCYFAGDNAVLIIENAREAEPDMRLHNFQPSNRMQFPDLPLGPPAGPEGAYITGIRISGGSLFIDLAGPNELTPLQYDLNPTVPIDKLKLESDGTGGTFLIYLTPVE